MSNFARPEYKKADSSKFAAQLNQEWKDLCAIHLPLFPENSIWRYSRAASPDNPRQGWKIHLSATVLNAADILRAVAPFLDGLKIQFKAPSTLFELMKLNAGIFYGYSQIGKFITIYPKTDEEFVFLVEKLHLLTISYRAPTVPFDFRYKKTGNVFYRFGVFRENPRQAGENPAPFLISPSGESVPDACRSAADLPDWVKIPFRQRKSNPNSKKNPLQTTYKVFRALSQRGKGGVYLAFDDREKQQRRLCVLKEGRKNGETAWDGRDGLSRVRNEERILKDLFSDKISVPQIYDSFRLENNYYLVTEFIDGVNLKVLLSREKPMLAQALGYGFQLSQILAQIHAAGWVWRDCKPENIIVSADGTLKVIDFEGACRAGRAESLIWITPGFAPPEALENSYKSANIAEDLYALGRILSLLTEGDLPATASKSSQPTKHRKVSDDVSRVVSKLLDANPSNRPSAESAAQTLKSVLDEIN